MFQYANMDELHDPHRYMFLTVACPMCGGNQKEITVNGEDLFKYNQGAFVQDAFPYLSDGDREQLFMTGICSACFDAMGADDSDYDDGLSDEDWIEFDREFNDGEED